MDDGLKQRLLGALVLLALAVIFIPVLFDRERMEPVNTTSQIPRTPILEIEEVPDPQQPEWSRPVEPPAQQFVPDETAVVSDAAEPDTLDAHGQPQAWVLQIGSFQTEQLAIAARDKLTGLGHTAYIRKVQVADETVHRVYVGPKMAKDALMTAKVAIDQALQVESLLLAFKP